MKLSQSFRNNKHRSIYPEKTCMFINLQVCVDVFLTTQTFVDIASISVVPRTTGGQVSKIRDLVNLLCIFIWNSTFG